jgi:hypothetical protein
MKTRGVKKCHFDFERRVSFCRCAIFRGFICFSFLRLRLLVEDIVADLRGRTLRTLACFSAEMQECRCHLQTSALSAQPNDCLFRIGICQERQTVLRGLLSSRRCHLASGLMLRTCALVTVLFADQAAPKCEIPLFRRSHRLGRRCALTHRRRCEPNATSELTSTMEAERWSLGGAPVTCPSCSHRIRTMHLRVAEAVAKMCGTSTVPY